MESLVRLVVIILLTIIGAGVLAFLLGRKSPRNIFTKIVRVVIGVFAVWSGGWLALLQIGLGARLIGLLVAIAGIRLLLKTFQKPKPR